MKIYGKIKKGHWGGRGLFTAMMALFIILSPFLSFSFNGDLETPTLDPGAKISAASLDIKSRKDLGDIILDGSNTLEITGTCNAGDIILSGESVLFIHNAVLTIKGVLRANGSAQMKISKSKVMVMPTQGQENESAMDFEDEASFSAANSNVTVIPAPLPPGTPLGDLDYLINKGPRIPFVMFDDQASLYFRSGDLRVNLPWYVVPMYVNNQQYVTAGSILLTGQSNWTFIESHLMGKLNYTKFGSEDDPVIELTRWFWLSTQRDATLYLSSCVAELDEPGETLFKPTAGSFFAYDSTLRGQLQPETIAKVVMEDCISELVNNQLGWRGAAFKYPIKMYDHVEASIVNCSFDGYIQAGWSSTDDMGGFGGPEVHMQGVTVNGEMEIYSQSKIVLDQCDITSGKIMISDNSSLELQSMAIKEIEVNDGYFDMLFGVPDQLARIPERISLKFISTSIDLLTLDSPNGSVNIILDQKSVLDDLRGQGDLDLSITSQDGSNLGSINISHGIHISMEVINTTIPNFSHENLSIIETRQLRVSALINGRELPGCRFRLDNDLGIFYGEGDDQGGFTFNYLYGLQEGDAEFRFGRVGTLQCDYYGLQASKTLKLRDSSHVQFNLTDDDLPRISSVKASPRSWILGREILVSARIKDDTVGVVENVTLHYRYGNSPWLRVPMQERDNETYIGSLPPGDRIESLEYYITAQDMAGNQQSSQFMKVEIGEEVCTMIWVVLGISIVSLLVVLIIRGIKSSRQKRFIRGKL